MTGPEHRATDGAKAVGSMPAPRGALSGYRWRILAALATTAMAAALAAGCASGVQSGDDGTDQAAAAQPTAAVVNELESCEAGLPIDDQKKRLAAIAGAQFSGATTHDPELSRLHYPPDVRDVRTSGIFV